MYFSDKIINFLIKNIKNNLNDYKEIEVTNATGNS
jgi:hypothetical protein